MAQGTRSKAFIVDKSAIDKKLDDTSNIYNDLTSHRSSRKESPCISLRGQESKLETYSLIVSHEFGFFILSPQILRLWHLNLA